MSERAFDVCGPLPTGITVLEASAGTGKTYTIAALAARYVAEGTPLDKLLLVTFTRMATGELRDRVRERLVAVERGLEVGSAAEPTTRSCGCSPTRRRRRSPCGGVRLIDALADFDAATIATTHGFCQEVLGGLGVVGDVERDVVFVEDVDDLLAEVVDDLYVRRFYRPGDAPPFKRDEAMKIARAAIANPSPPAGAGLRARGLRGGDAVRPGDRRHQGARGPQAPRRGDHLRRPADPSRAPRCATRTRCGGCASATASCWSTSSRTPTRCSGTSCGARSAAGVALVLIGDPKQAIYAFRGADVYAYLDAARGDDARDPERQPAQRPGADRRLRRPARRHAASGTRTSSTGRCGPRHPHPLAGARRRPAADPARRARDPRHGADGQGVRREVPDARPRRPRPRRRRRAPADLGRARIDGRPIEPGDVAVLVRTNRQAALVRDALGRGRRAGGDQRRGQRVRHRRRPSTGCGCWRRSSGRARRCARTPCALTPFLGWSAEQVASASEEEWERIHARLHRWAQVLRLEGVASLSERITLVEGLPGAGARRGRRRARADRPAPRRPAPARRGDAQSSSARPR